LRHIPEEVLQEGVQAAEGVGLFLVPVVPVISLAPLVVITDRGIPSLA
jgi:hypothetical protein